MFDQSDSTTSEYYSGKAAGIEVRYVPREVLGQIRECTDTTDDISAVIVAYKSVCKSSINRSQAAGIVQLFMFGHVPDLALLRYARILPR